MASGDGERVTILFMIDNLRPGGAQKALLSIVRGLNRRCVEPVLWCLGGTSDVEDQFRGEGVRVLRFPRVWTFTGLAVLWILGYMLRRRVAVVHTFLFHADNVGRLLGRIARVPVVISSVRATNLRKKSWQFALDRVTARWADAVTAVSQRTLEFAVAREGIPRDRAIVIPNGIDVPPLPTARERRNIREELHISASAFVIGTAGRLHEQKGHRFLLEAAQVLIRQQANLLFLIAGYGPLRRELEAVARALGVADHVRFLGYRQDVPRLLRAMDLFVLPSLWEGMSNALLEAMAAATPAVATAVDGNLDLIVHGDTGLLVPPADASALADAILEMQRDPRRARAMAAAARARAASEFSTRTMVNAYGQLYNNLLRKALGVQTCEPVMTGLRT